MKYFLPAIISFILSATAAVLIYLGKILPAEIILPIAFLAGIVSFKKRGSRLSAAVHFLAAALMAFLFYDKTVFPFLSIAMILTGMQNGFLEIFFERIAYSNKWFKLTVGSIAVSCYFAGNILYPSNWQTWLFPGIALLFANLLSLVITMDIFALIKPSTKGYVMPGNACPVFSLPDETGKQVSSKDFLGKILLLVFVRGDWCPGCHITLRSYQRNKEKFLERGVHLLSIGPDPLGVNKEMVLKLGLTFNVLSDERSDAAKQFCVELQDARPGTVKGEFIPLPASFLIDKNGIVQFTSRADVPGEILHPDKIFEVLDSLR